jgi:hypothetical protein
MNLSSRTFCLLGIALIIATILGTAVAVLSFHKPPSTFVALTVPLPPQGSSLPLTPEQLAEERAPSDPGGDFERMCLGLLFDAFALAGIILLVTGLVKRSRQMKNAQVSN